MSEVSWPDALPTLTRVRQWIAAQWPSRSEVSGPTQVYTAYATPPDIRVTARFSVAGQGDVVFQANLFPPLAGAGALIAHLSSVCPGDVPRVLAWEPQSPGWFLLAAPFVGAPVDTLSPLVETARTLARIQTAFAATPPTTDVPGIMPGEVPGQFDAVLAAIRAAPRVWAEGDGPLTQALGFPAAGVLDRLMPLRSQIIAGAKSLAPWPLSIDHGDLHAGNAVGQPGGRVLIYDWENAVVGCPFFSLDKLLVSAWNLDAGTHGPWGFVAGTPTQTAVRAAYLEALPWGDLENRAAALDHALRLATVKEMTTEIAWARTMGWPDDNPEWTAQLIRRLLQYTGT